MNNLNPLHQRIQWEIAGIYEDNPKGLSATDELYVAELKKIVQAISSQILPTIPTIKHPD